MSTAVSTCPSNKRVFDSEQDAIEFEVSNRKQHNTLRQYPQACDDCNGWHLSPLPPNSERFAEEAEPGAPQTSRNGDRTGPKNISTAEVFRLHESGMTIKEVAAALKVSVSTVTYHLYKKGPKPEAPVLAVVPATLTSISQRKAELKRQLEEAEAEEKRLLEQTQLQIQPMADGLMLKKENTFLRLDIPELGRVVNLLYQKFPNIVNRAPQTTPVTKWTPKQNMNVEKWDALPEFATDAEKDLPIYHAPSNTRLASGYVSLLTLGTVNPVDLVEVADSQVVHTQFTRMNGEDDYQPYETYEIPSGFRCRKYIQDDGDMRAGHWYFHMHFVVPGTPLAPPPPTTMSVAMQNASRVSA